MSVDLEMVQEYNKMKQHNINSLDFHKTVKKFEKTVEKLKANTPYIKPITPIIIKDMKKLSIAPVRILNSRRQS